VLGGEKGKGQKGEERYSDEESQKNWGGGRKRSSLRGSSDEGGKRRRRGYSRTYSGIVWEKGHVIDNVKPTRRKVLNVLAYRGPRRERGDRRGEKSVKRCGSPAGYVVHRSLPGFGTATVFIGLGLGRMGREGWG